MTVANIPDPGALADFVASNVRLKPEDRQTLLGTADVRERLRLVNDLLQREAEVADVERKIRSQVQGEVDKRQREFILREQLKAIQKELGELEPSPEAADLRQRLADAHLPAEAQREADRELERLAATQPASAEYQVIRTYLEWLADLPWSVSTEDNLDLAHAEQTLNEDHYGLEKVKQRILDFLAVRKLRPDVKGPILCFVGPPGTGKTSLGQSIARTLGRKFLRLSLGGIRDEAEIRGHRRTYVGSMPGRIIQTLRRVETRNPVILLDELDKVGSDFRGDPASALLEVLDPQQNSGFTDLYLDVPFDLSQVLFITTANWLDPIHAALRDRLEVINLPSYTAAEKLQIAKRYLVPRQLEEHGLQRKQVKFPDAALRHLIEQYTHEAGVRQLEREIASLTRKAARRIVSRHNRNGLLVITAKSLNGFLGHPQFLSESAEKITDHGIATGLAWTPVGGEILFIEATRMPGKGQLTLTGSLGEVMKESAQTALSYLRSQTKSLRLQQTDFSKFDIHIHVPAGATPKDGPSAGATIVVALASLLTQRLVRSDLAMTGEISLRGRILRVGGVKEKVLAAARSGLKGVILPAQNKGEWLEVPAEVRRKMKIYFVDHIGPLIRLALK